MIYSGNYFGDLGIATYHEVVSGDWLSKIAQQYGTTVSKLMIFNRFIIDPNVLKAGQVLLVRSERGLGPLSEEQAALKKRWEWLDESYQLSFPIRHHVPGEPTDVIPTPPRGLRQRFAALPWYAKVGLPLALLVVGFGMVKIARES